MRISSWPIGVRVFLTVVAMLAGMMLFTACSAWLFGAAYMTP